MNGLCVLISCMHQKNKDIVALTNVQTDAVVVNQCGFDKIERYTFVNKKGRKCKICFINTTERGLSKSRNMAIRYAEQNICLICDDDEYLHDNYEQTIIEAYNNTINAGVIAFSLIRKDVKKVYPLTPGCLGFRQILKTSSLQITFNKKIVMESGISFDEKMGSGTGNGGGEENKFLFDCRRKKLMLRYNPNSIATINPGVSQWFKGYTNQYFENLGWASRRIFGAFIGFVYCLYFIISHRHIYTQDNSTKNAFLCVIRGWRSKR